MPAVSVLVPCYNVERFIRPCMDSIVGQTLTDMEIICLNDGSTDGTLAVLEEYAARDSRIRIISKPNSGYGDSMNKGLEAATGEYIGIVESDDIAQPEMFEEMLNHARATGADMVKCAHERYWSSPERRELRPVPELFADRLVTPQEVADLTQFPIAIWAALYRRAMLEEREIRFTTTPGASYQDTAFNFKAWVSARTVYVTSKPLYLYRQDNMSSSVKSRRKIFCVAHEYHSIERFLKRWGLEEEWGTAKDKAKFRGYRWNFKRLGGAGRKRFLPLMRKEYGDILNKGNPMLDRREWRRLKAALGNPCWYLLMMQYRDWMCELKTVVRGK